MILVNMNVGNSLSAIQRALWPMAQRTRPDEHEEWPSPHCLRRRRYVVLGDEVRLRGDQRRQELGSPHR